MRNTSKEVALFALLGALLLSGCKSRKPAPPPEAANPAIVEVRDSPGSPFQMQLILTPTQPHMGSKTRFRVLVREGASPVNQAKLQGSLVMPLMDMGKNEFPLRQAGDGAYEGLGEFSMSGEWECVFTATAADGKTGKTTFNVKVAD